MCTVLSPIKVPFGHFFIALIKVPLNHSNYFGRYVFNQKNIDTMFHGYRCAKEDHGVTLASLVHICVLN